ncbi:MAG: GNAT family N-acetyltransferase [Ruminococcus sp.]|nr:GNAT family N-acetyltransferase [Ruminococcus sp.]
MIIRRFNNTDAASTSSMIANTLRICNTKDYTPELMEECIKSLSPDNIISRASWMHFYVVEEEGSIIGCGGIGPYWGKNDESSLFTIFVDADRHGEGIGRLIMNTLEQDEFFLRAKRIEIPSSITALNFYKKFGYDHKKGFEEPDEEQIYRLEKFR